LLSVLVREGDLPAAGVPLAELAGDAAGWPEDGAAVRRQVDLLAALAVVWRARLGASAAERVDDGEAGDADAAPFVPDPALAQAVRALARLEGAARARLGGPGWAPPAGRLGSASEVRAAYARAVARRPRPVPAQGLWPLPPRLPVWHHMRRILGALRRRRRLHLVPAGAAAGEAVAATLAALELVRRGRVHLWQARPYAPVVVLRPRDGTGT
jgi:hypothetical protein